MKFSNPTHRKEFRRCPKRYFFRYLYQPPSPIDAIEHSRRRQLYGIRELGGHLIHRTAASMVRAMVSGEHWDHQKGAKSCVDEFLLIVAKSLATDPGEWIEGYQLAETFNGAAPWEIEDDVRHWRDLIPIALENAFRVAHSLNLRRQSSGFKVETEKLVVWSRGDQKYRLVLDLVIQSPFQTLVVDWKTHEIDNEDIHQVRHYLRYLHFEEQIPATQVYGLAVNLNCEDVVKVTFDPYFANRSHVPMPKLSTQKGSLRRDPFKASPHPEICRSCPYAGICPAAAVSSAPAGTAAANVI